MAYDDDEDFSGDDDYSTPAVGSVPTGGGALSLLSLTDPYTTQEAQGYARKILKNTIDNQDTEEAPYFERLKANAETTRQALRAARERIAAEKYGNSEKWLAAAAAFGSPTRTGSFGETLGNVAGSIIDPIRKEREFNRNRDDALTKIDLGLAGVDDHLTAAQLQLLIAKQTRNGAMAREALKVLGKQLAPSQQLQKNQQQNDNNLNRKYAEDYNAFALQGGAADAAKALEDLGIARDKLRGYKVDPESGQKVPLKGGKKDNLTGPIIGTVSNIPWIGKTIQDTVFPESADTQETVEYQIQRSLRPILGAQFTKEEGERLIARVYNPRLSEEVNAKRLDRLIQQLQRAYQAKIDAAKYYETHNHSLQGFRGKVQWSVDDLWPQGKNEPKTEPQSNSNPRVKSDFLPDDPVIDYADLVPAGEDDPYLQPQAHAEGGQVSDDGIVEHHMPDGRIIRAPAAVPYEKVLQRYEAATGQHFEQPHPDQSPQPPPAADTGGEEAPADEGSGGGMNFDIPTTIELGGSAVGHGLLGATGGRYGVKMGQGLMDLLPGYKMTPAQEKVLSSLEAEGLSPSEWVKLINQANKYGVPMTGIDVGDYGAMRQLGDSAMNPENPQTAELFKQTKKRQDQARTRVEGRVNQSLAPDDYFQKMKDLRGELKTNSKPMYDELSKKYPFLKSESLMQIMNTPSGKKAVKEAVKSIRDRPGSTLGKQDAMGMITKPSIEFLDEVKQQLDDMIMKEEGTGPTYQATSKGKRLRALRNSLRDEVDKLTTDPKTGVSAYKEARSQYAGDIEVMDALRLGRDDFFKLQPKELLPQIENMSFSEKDALRTGVAQKLFEQIRGPSGKGNIASKIIDSPDNQERLAMLFDTPTQAKVFTEALKAEAKIYDESRSTLAAGRRAQGASQVPVTGVKKVVKDAPTIGIFSPVQWVLRAIRRNPKMSKEEAAQILDMLRTNNPKELAKIEKQLAPKVGRAASRKSIRGKAGYLGAAIGAAYPFAKKFFGDEEAPADETDDEEPNAYARGGLVRRKPDWQEVTEQVLNQSMFGCDDLVSHFRKV